MTPNRRVSQPVRTTFAHELLTAVRAELMALERVRFPSPKYQKDPVLFAREILGIEPWAKQVEILEAVRDHPRVAITSGHKTGKSASAAMVALWFYCSHEDARVVMTSTTSRQVDQILWRELRMMRARGGRCVACKRADPEGRRTALPCPHSTIIDGEQGEVARTGLKSSDFREVVGFTAREAEAVAGISGKNLIYLVDEASGVNQDIFEAIEGNRAGGARIVLFSNPTRNEGEFFDAFHEKSRFYKTITISSEETPNVVEGRDVVPGLATRAWVEEKADEWGRESPMFKVRVQGAFALAEEGRIFSVAAIAGAEERWEDTPAEGRLFIGIDPAGASGRGDETAFCVRRGKKAILLQAHRGLSEDGILANLLRLIGMHRNKPDREIPVVVLDSEGPIGGALRGTLNGFLDGDPNAFDVVSVRASDRAWRQSKVYDRVRDELVANLEAWIRDGGAIPEDRHLASELHSLEWTPTIAGKLKVTPKETIRKVLGRSTDRMDALALSVWEPMGYRASRSERYDHDDDDRRPALDPWAAQADLTRAIDPYGGSSGFRRRR